MPNYIDPTKDSFKTFRDMQRAGPVHMLNLLQFHATAQYPDGRTSTGAQAYASYARESGAIFQRLGGKQIWVGAPELMLIGPQEKHWDLAFIAEYPSVDAFVAMLRDPDYRNAVIHRQAAVKDSRLIRMNPAQPGATFGEVATQAPPA